jgi:hypothetical protein
MRASLEYYELESALRRWGEWQELHYLDASVPHQSSHTLIYSDQPAGHKILCAEMERSVWKVNYLIQHLPRSHRDTLMLWYAVNIKLQGGFWDAREKASRLGIRLNVLRMRVTRARRALHRKIFLTAGYLRTTNSSRCITASAEPNPPKSEELLCL